MSADNDRDFERLLQKDVFDWSVADVGIWVDYIGMGEYKLTFIQNVVSGLELLDLETDDLTALGVKRVGHRKKILSAIKQLEAKNTSRGGSSAGGSRAASSSGKAPSTASDDSWSGSQGSATKDDIIAAKCFYKDDIAVISVRPNTSFRRFKNKVKKEFGRRMTLKYEDADGDRVPLRKERDWKTALKTCRSGRLRVICTPTRSRRQQAQRQELSVLESMPDPMIMINEKGIINFFNSAAAKCFGFNKGEVMGQNVKMLMNDEDANKHDRYLSTYLKTGKAKVIGKGRRVKALRKNGEKFDAYLTISESKTRRSRSFIGTLQDLSSRQDDDIIASDQTSHYTILEGILDAAIVINEQGTVQFYNSAAYDLLGWKAAQVIGRNITMLQQGKDKKEHDQYLKKYLATGESTVIGKGREVIAVHRDGGLIRVHLSVSEQKVGAKRLFTGILRPVQIEESISSRTVLEQQREVLDNLMVAAIMIDPFGVIKAFNQSAVELLGYSLIEVVGKNVKMIMTSKDREKHDGYLEKWRTTGEEHVFGVGRDLVAQKKDGSAISIRLSVTKRKDEKDQWLCTGTLQPI
eukprot:CAMPEP_0201552156 /NCGR_PEP_ID=MMETSP0173_2-20130828/14524_1 /ASSEMBLY_ACC=CAM_ASM_000268 /TAXON_ID=218659 /ORGANISM="Vexillifera sp., Strain DIVA3 564/2" /LENGTH=577 /DNA_ID=CAMNT_0047962589 /DNA_START=6 /DNA_END=1739 /DNA_ORIENTATION=-